MDFMQAKIARGLDGADTTRLLRFIRQELDMYRHRVPQYVGHLPMAWQKLDEWMSAGAGLPGFWTHPHMDPSYESCRWRVIDDPAAALQEIRVLVTPSETTEWPPLPDLAEAVGGLDRWMTEHTGPWPDLWGTGRIPKHNNGKRTRHG